ncbi:DUF2190 family protein [Nocardioides sp. SYSU D00065]|uniref:DUF2190 family protein n=1 Tax=Nocardioides sp. SYSU D00065 TaxID=2817378 RepID=UPI001B33A845|nr:DUF2190 family protein [Nocardioides sp. SYSU D00065]
MATNEKFRPGDKVSLPVPAGTKAGAPLRIGGLNAVAQTDRAKVDVSPTNADGTTNTSYNYGGGNPNGHASCWLDGAHEFTVDFAVSGVGEPIYITGANALSGTATGNNLYGHALTTKGAPSGPLTVRLAN